MAGFYIRKVIARSDNKKDDSIVTFSKGLNIIQGYSDTGKTCIAKCIDFIFGGHTTIPFEKSTNYNTVIMIVCTNIGDIQLTRKVGRNQVDVMSNVMGIDSDLYDLKYQSNGKQKHPVLNNLWLRLIGITEEHKIVANKDFVKRRLTWKNLLRLVYIDEDEISQSESIIEPQQYVEKTLFLSALLFLISGRDFSETDAKTKKEIKIARRQAVETYVNIKISDARKRKDELYKNMTVFDDIDIEKKIAEVVSSLEATESAIVQAMNKSKKILNAILNAEQRAAECDILLNRYHYLQSQYEADIKRLTFIVNGEAEIKKLPQNTTCPFCDSRMTLKSRKSYIDSSRAELSRIILQLKGLSETEADVQQENVEIHDTLKKLNQERNDIELIITEELKPKAGELNKTLVAYRTYIQLNNEIALVEKYAQDWEIDLDALSNDNEGESVEYHPKEYFDDTFQTQMTKYAEEILRECNYESFTAARFNLQDFDIEVNGMKKATSHGQGYRSYLNTVVALMFRKYLASDYAKYNPGLLIIDTPLLGLNQGVDDAAPESMRTALFKYFMSHQNEGQLIVIENLDHIPKLNYEESGATVVTFTKGHSEGRYGFLNDVK